MSDDLLDWFAESDGFAHGTKAPHKWVLQAEQEIRWLQARVAELEAVLKATLDREAVAYSRHDARAEAAEARVAELEVLLTTARQLVTHAATELAQSAQDMSAMRAERALHKAIAAIQEGRG